MITEVTAENQERARGFLEQHLDTSLFLLGNLASLGPRRDASLNSGNFRMIEEDGRVVAVFCLSRRGNLLLQSGGRAEFARAIVEACDNEPIPIEAVVGEWSLAEAAFRILKEERGLKPTYYSKEILYGQALVASAPAFAGPESGLLVRRLEPSDFEAWERLNRQYLIEAGFPVQGSLEQRRAGFESSALAEHWWGAFDGGELVSTAGLNARYADVGQVGGVFTLPSRRNQGLARDVMRGLARDALDRHHLSQLLLFTGEDNVAARRMYERLGYEQRGYFALLFGEARVADAGRSASPTS